MEELAETEYAALVTEIKSRIRMAQYEALRAVNKELIDLYWNIGKMIVERQQGKIWGQSVVRKLAADIRDEFPGIQGFSPTNMWRMKMFYEAYRDSEKVPPLVGLIGWSHNSVILEQCKDDLEREFYIDLGTYEGNSWPVIKILPQPLAKARGRRMQIGDKLPTVSFYNGDFSQLHWKDFDPVAVNCVTDDDNAFLDALWRLNQRTDEDIWGDLEKYLVLVPQPYRPGLYWMRTQ